MLHDIILEDHNQNRVKLYKLLKKKTVLVKLLRELDCPLTRYECKLLKLLNPYFEKIGVKVVIITYDEENFDDFMAAGCWNGTILIDQDKLVYRALGLYCLSKGDAIIDLNYSSFIFNKFELRNDINFQTPEYCFQLGGTFLFRSSKIIFEFRQTSASSFPSIKELFIAADGDPDLVEELTPLDCIRYTKQEEHNQSRESRRVSKLRIFNIVFDAKS